jgi:type VI secretion system secreted protein Hcp
MPGNAFMKFTNNAGQVIVGESPQKGHEGAKGWIEINDWSWDIESGTNFLKGTGASIGVATPGTFSFTHTFDKSSPSIMTNIVMGTSFATVVVHMLKSTGEKSGQPEVYFGVKIVDAFITKVSSKGNDEGSITQDVEFVFKSIAMAYKQQLNTGKLGSIMPFGWDIAQKTMTPGITLALNAASD